MKAAIYRSYGPPSVVTLAEVPTPAPGPRDVLVRVHATTVTAGDWRLRSADVPLGFGPVIRLAFGIFGPRQPVLGTELAGVVESVGKAVARFRPGDRVFAFAGAKLGCHAEYKVLPENAAIAPLPSGFSFEEAAALSFGGTTALYFLRDRARLRPGERVLVNGASGAVGSAAVQLAQHFGARVTGVCSAANVALVGSLGAERVIDYGQADFRRSGETWDVILDTVGNCTFDDCKGALAPGGRLLLVVADLPTTLAAALRPSREGRKVLGGAAPERRGDVLLLRDLAEAGAYRPVIDRVVPFDRIVEAHALVESRHKKGNVVVSVRPGTGAERRPPALSEAPRPA